MKSSHLFHANKTYFPIARSSSSSEQCEQTSEQTSKWPSTYVWILGWSGPWYHVIRSHSLLFFVLLWQSKFTWSDSGHFATSIEPRYPRPPSIKYRIGQVVKHKQYGYRFVCAIYVNWLIFNTKLQTKSFLQIWFNALATKMSDRHCLFNVYLLF